MAERRPPSVRGRQLAHELRRLREIDGRTSEQVAAALGWSSSKVSRIENGVSRLRPADLRELLDLFGTDDQQREVLTALARKAHQRGWWVAYPGVGDDYAFYLELESDAQTVHCYSALSLHGLLQTEEYARAIIGSGAHVLPGIVQDRVQVRMRRQSRLREDSPITLHAVLDETTIRREVGGREVMRAQLRRLIELAGLPNVTIQLLPFAAGAHASMAGSFITLMGPYPSSNAVYVEMHTGGAYVDDDADVYKYSAIFEKLRNHALSPEETLGSLRRAMTGG